VAVAEPFCSLDQRSQLAPRPTKYAILPVYEPDVVAHSQARGTRLNSATVTIPYRYSPILPYPKVKRPVLAGQEIGCESFSSSSLYALLVELATASFLPRLLPGHVSWNAELGRLPRQYARNGEGQGLLGHGEKRPARTHAYPLPSCQTFFISTQVLKATSPGS
jgi:hypothetical protein